MSEQALEHYMRLHDEQDADEEYLAQEEEREVGRIAQVNYIEGLARDISSSMPAEVTHSDAKEVVEWWIHGDYELPSWFDSHDEALLVSWTSQMLERIG